MPRPKRPDLHANMAADIKAAAKAQMAEYGTAGLSLRGIARALDITAPAIYNYFPRLEDLITALIVDAYTELAEAQEAAVLALPVDAFGARMMATAHAYRDWALAHPIQFQLIYGNPIPGYVAPVAVTVPLARRGALLVLNIATAAYAAGVLTIPPDYQHIPAPIDAYMGQWMAEMQVDFPPELMVINFSAWTRLYGLVMLEIIGHLGPAIGDPAAFFQHELEQMLHNIGLA